MYCATCKIEFPDSYRFCPLCGRSAVQNDKNITPSGTTTETINGTAAGTTVATTAQTTENTVSTQTPENVSANSGSNSAPVTSESTAESSNSQNTSGASQATQNANAYEPVRSTKIPVKTEQERQEDAIWSSFKNEDSYSRDRNYNNDYTGYTPNYNYSRQSSAKPIAIVGIVSAVLILGFTAWHFSWFGINNNLAKTLNKNINYAKFCHSLKHDSELDYYTIGNYIITTDNYNRVQAIGYSNDSAKGVDSSYNIEGVYPGQSEEDAKYKLRSKGYSSLFDEDGAEQILYSKKSGDDTILVRCNTSDGTISSVTCGYADSDEYNLDTDDSTADDSYDNYYDDSYYDDSNY